MDTKWKNRLSVAAWLLALAYGISGVLILWLETTDYWNQNWFFWVYMIGAVTALVTGFIMEKNNGFLIELAPVKWQFLYKKIPLDIALILFVLTVFFTFLFFIQDDFFTYIYLWETIEDIIFHLTISTLLLSLTLAQAVYLHRRLTDFPNLKEDWRHSLPSRFVAMNRTAFLNRKVGTKVFIILTLIFLLGSILGLCAADEDFFAFFLIAFVIVGIPLFILIVRRIGYFNRILLNAEALANGQFEQEPQIKGKSILAKLALDLNHMKYGVRTSQQEQAKSERLKTELITNVSHDLRTPLTSIMTYTQLLKNETVTEDERTSYIEIIDRKSKRLKVLIDDLFEASKMASGTIELVKNRVDVVELLTQALAEYNEAIEASAIQLRVSIPEGSLYAFVDGQKMWRVFENLIGNILKYSLPNTRAYIQVRREAEQVIITFKNISEYEPNGSIDELTERFKRGDESRHTEGSGLGLAIAGSIVDLHGGTMDIEVDDDLFKVAVKLDVLK